ncbi:MAG: patatin-like phospholipase family protein [Colwellia sp.]|nr:patatin-like phospholipase family protein [Colwellia sp.]MCW8864921.1 patatin-like phospholipase family protein [Colwellia sp.]MCW9080539.1 patatin-like phospholipase family protein [Colwellia sp.]
MRSLFILLLVVASTYCANLVAQTQHSRPKIGVVLSGGGAKGAAHIGVLKVLEKHHVPVDYVVGTSIGAYVGGLYALGYSAAQIEEIMLKLPWDNGYSDFIPRQQLSFENKKLRDRYNLTFHLGYSEGELKTPSGLLLGQSAGQLLKLSTDTVPQFTHFDELAIPYRAIASNIATSKMVVIEKGSISKAMRASAAVPGVVEPVKIDGQLLVDGGITNNMPVDVVKAMGADIVIAVDIGSPLLDKEDIGSTIDVINQLSNILTNTTTLLQKEHLSEQDILLRPAIDDLSTTDFSIMPQALALGEKIALSAQDKISQLTINLQEYEDYQADKNRKSQTWFDSFDKPVVSIVYQNNSNVSEVIIKEKFAIKEGDVVTKEALDAAINRVYAINEFEHVDAEFIDLPEGRQLILMTEKKSWGPDYLHFGFSLQSDFNFKSILALDVAYINNDITPNGGEWRNEAKLGWESSIATEFYQPIDKSQYFFSRSRIEFIQDKWEPTETRPELVNEHVLGNLGLGINYTGNGAIEFGFIGEKGKLSFKDEVSASLDYHSLGGYASFGYDNLDSINFPTQGNKLAINAFWRSDHYDDFEGVAPKDTSLEIQLDWRGAFSLNHHAFVGIASFATVENDSDFSVHVTELGGFLNLSGFQKDALIGVHKAFAAIVYQYDLGRELFGNASLPMYIGTSFEAGNVWTVNESVKLDDVISSGSLYLGTDTSFGPAVFGIGFASGGKSSVFISLGKSF